MSHTLNSGDGNGINGHEWSHLTNARNVGGVPKDDTNLEPIGSILGRQVGRLVTLSGTGLEGPTASLDVDETNSGVSGEYLAFLER